MNILFIRQWWNDIGRKTEELGEKLVPVPLFPPLSYMD
jgi:hypothetical protein